MIVTRLRRCRAWCHKYITRYPGLTCEQIEGATTDYTHEEIFAALYTLVAFGDAAAEDRRFTALIPFEEQPNDN